MFCKIDQRKNEAIFLYKDKKFTLKQVGNEFCCSAETVRRRFEEWGIKIRKTGEYLKGVKKTDNHRLKLKNNLDRIRPKAIQKSKELWSSFNGEKISRKEFLNKIREKAIIERKKISNSGSNNPKWKGGVSFSYFKQKVLARDGRICQICGYKEHPEIIEVHHIDGNHGNNDISNGIALCPNCHRIEEFKNKTFHTKLRRKKYETA